MTAQPKVFLRALEEGDLERTCRWHNDPELYHTLVDGFRFVSEQAESDWLAKRVNCSQTEVNLAICLSPGKKHIGNIYLRPINLTFRNAVLGIFIGEKIIGAAGLAARRSAQYSGTHLVTLACAVFISRFWLRINPQSGCMKKWDSKRKGDYGIMFSKPENSRTHWSWEFWRRIIRPTRVNEWEA